MKEKTADETFEELGYMTELIENNTGITLAKLKAINKKVGELGWGK